MKILSLHIDGFGKFHDRDISFEDGLNVVYGKNEAGKSTLHTFIKGMLFGIERQRGRASKNDTYSKFQPWFPEGGQAPVRDQRNLRKRRRKYNCIIGQAALRPV